MKLTSQLATSSVRAGRRLRRRLGDFIADRRGFSAMTFAISAIPMFGLVGLAVDVGTAYHMKAQVQQAADTVATQLARRSMNDVSLNSQQLLERGRLMMSDNLDFAISYNKFDVKLTDKEVEITAQAQFNTNFSKMVGISKLDISASAKARYHFEEADIFVLVDNTPSMLIGATVSEANKMLGETGCEFACHQGYTEDRYSVALRNGYKLRFSAVKDAINNLTAHVKKEDPTGKYYRVGIYSFESGYNSGLRKDHDLSNNLVSINTTANNLMPSIAHERDTNFNTVMYSIQQVMKSAKVGKRKQILLMVSDGLHDHRVSVPGSIYWWGYYMGTVPQNRCADIKNDGVALAILETPYSSPSYSNWYWYRLVVPKIPGAMKDCASPGLFGQVDFSNPKSYDIEMEKLVGKATRYGPRLVRNNPAGINNN